MSTVKMLRKTGWLASISLLVAYSGSSVAANLSLPDLPLFLPESVPPLNMIVLGRDHKLYYEAYNDYTDLDDDGGLDIGYKGYILKSPAPPAPASPYKIDYYGYFDSYKCYTHDASGTDIGTRFTPVRVTTDKTCGGTGEWSGDFLNYLTTSRIDALRKVLYGGYRSTDDATSTVLERSFIPQDAHSWGKEYTSKDVDGYEIRKYTPYTAPDTGKRHLFANTTPLGKTTPRLRVLTNRTERIWNWVSIERPVAGTEVLDKDGKRITVTPVDFAVRVAVCVSGLLESNCSAYPNGNYKPTGLLQEFGENDSMYFGLLSGSYAKNTSGGVLRRKMSSITEEINPKTGVFRAGVYKDGTLTANAGIITTLNRLKVTGFGGNYVYNCGWDAAARTIKEGECQMWGNPIGEMMYESMRYFAGKASPTGAFFSAYGEGEEKDLTGGGLPVEAWDDPYESRPVCSKPFETVVSDINPSYDTDQVPGNPWNSFSGDLSGLNVATLGQKIWDNEFAGSREVFIGESNGISDNAPTPKTVTSFGNIRGLSPEEPTKQGGYTSASVAYYGKTNDLNAVAGEQKVSTFSVALASPLPKISIPVDGKTVTLVPFAKSVNGSGIKPDSGLQPTDQIVDFYVDTLTPTSGTFRVNFEDVEQGADHDMDAIVVYSYEVVGNQVKVTLKSEYAAGGITQHIGYVISGTTHDGIYLEVRDKPDSGETDVDYALDTPPAFQNSTPPAPSDKNVTGTWKDGKSLPTDTASRTFDVGTSGGAILLRDPLWYAAKWGGFDESGEDAATRNDIPDINQEWDADGDGTPDNYFLVTNALKLSEQLRKAFQDILRKTTSSSSASVNSGSISSDTRVYQARFNTGEWTGQLLSYKLDPTTGALITPYEWDASTKVPAAGSRQIVTVNSAGTAVPFKWDSLDSTRQAALGDATEGPKVLNYLRGDGSNEGQGDGMYRERKVKLGDIVSSSPLFVGRPPFRYRDSLESSPYSTFASDNAERQGMVYAGANDGMLHGFNAETGEEVFGFIPSPVFNNLSKLTNQNYSHQFYVDGPPSMGDVYFDSAWHTVLVGGLNKGGQGIYALDITDPASTLANAESKATNLMLWEFTDANDKDLGLTYSQPSIVRLHNGRWAAVFGNGYNNTVADTHQSTTGNAVLYVVEFGSGGKTYKFDTKTGTAQAPTGITYPNGLSTPSVVDIDGDRIADYVYAGDLYGNLWKFNITGTDSTSWGIAYKDGANPAPLFKAKDGDGNSQPITDRPEVARGPGGAGMMVLFGTGKYLENSDKLLLPKRIQSFYGIVDKNSGDSATDRVIVSGDRDDTLTEQTIEHEIYVYGDDLTQVPSSESTDDQKRSRFGVRTTSNNSLGANRGWYIDLLSPTLGYQAEKQVSNPIVRNGNVVFTTLIPDSDPCAFGGGSWIMELSLLDGSRIETTPFDLNNDGQFTDADHVTVTNPDGTKEELPISGLGSTEGILQSPGVIDGERGPEGQGKPVQYKYLPGSSGGIQRVTENPGVSGTGRQSWRQIR